ncbi:MAG: DUF5687 family protein [Flavobacteriaceae bacterium]
MFRHFIALQWKSFFRAASFKTNVAFRILMIFGALYFAAVFLALGVGSYYIMRDAGIENPLDLVNRYLIYYLAADLYVRYMLQKMPVMNIRPMLYLPFKKNDIVYYSLAKTTTSFFNWAHAFFFIPFSIVLLKEGYSVAGVLGWHFGLMALFYCNNFINIMMNNKDWLFYILIGILGSLGLAQYYGWFDMTQYTAAVFKTLYSIPLTAVLAWSLLAIILINAFAYFKKRMYLDGGLATKQAIAKTEDYLWLNRLGNLGTFLKNDIKLIKRNKRSRTTVIMSILFLFYGLLFFTQGIDTYDHPVWKIFAGIFVSGGFLFSFGQFVPSWDSAYYPLMMSQNIRYREYILSKWYLVIFATAISAVIGVFYLYFGWEAYLAVLVGAVYNIGVNSHLVLWGGAYIKTPIDLTSNKNAFGDKQAFNAKTLLLILPKIILPLLIFAIGYYWIHPDMGYTMVAVTGVMGFALKNVVFKKIEAVYKKEKYKTLMAYSEKS